MAKREGPRIMSAAEGDAYFANHLRDWIYGLEAALAAGSRAIRTAAGHHIEFGSQDDIKWHIAHLKVELWDIWERSERRALQHTGEA